MARIRSALFWTLTLLAAVAQAQDAVAVPDQFLTYPGHAATGNVFANDLNLSIDPTNQTILDKATLVRNASHGTVVLANDGTLTYTPSNNTYTGPDSFTYEVIGANGNASNIVTDTIAVGGCYAILIGNFSTFLIPSGTSSTGSAYLNFTPTTNTPVILTSSMPSLTTMPSSVTVLAGQGSANFPIKFGVVSSQTPITIGASLNGYTWAIVVTLTPPGPVGISIPFVSGGGFVIGGGPDHLIATVALNVAATGSGVKVNLVSSAPTAASVPSSVTVLAGNTTAAFTITHYFVGSPVPVRIAASANGLSASSSFSVDSYGIDLTVAGSKAGAVPSQLRPAIVACSDPGTNYNTATVTVNLDYYAPAAGLPLQISMIPNEYNLAGLVFPSVVTVPPLKQTVTFQVKATQPYDASLFANEGVPWFSFNIASSKVSLHSDPVYVYDNCLLGLGFNDGGTHAFAGDSVSMFASVLAPADSGTTVSLSSSSPYATVPASLTVNAATRAGLFSVSTKPLSSSIPVTVLGSFGGATRSATFLLVPAQVAYVFLNSDEVRGGTNISGYILFDGTTPSTGLTVTLFSSPGLVGPPTSVLVKSASLAAFSLPTKAVTKSTLVMVQAYTWQNQNMDYGPIFFVQLDP